MAFDTFVISLQAAEFNSFLLQSDHKSINKIRTDTLWKGDKKGDEFQDFCFYRPNLCCLLHLEDQ